MHDESKPEFIFEQSYCFKLLVRAKIKENSFFKNFETDFEKSLLLNFEDLFKGLNLKLYILA